MDLLNDFLAWAWERHQNLLSWYIRPLFLLPFCYFAYKRSLTGIIVTLIALATSMFWFPKPEQVDPQVQQFLQMEQEYLQGDWGVTKILMTLLVPGTLTALAYAFWKRSWMYGLLIINLIAVLKMIWSLYFGEGSGYAIIIPALTGLLVCNAVILGTYHMISKRREKKRTE